MVRYRPNVAALIVNPVGNLLICERWTIPGAWQFPQGGVDSGESLEQALYREVREEVLVEGEVHGEPLELDHDQLLGAAPGGVRCKCCLRLLRRRAVRWLLAGLGGWAGRGGRVQRDRVAVRPGGAVHVVRVVHRRGPGLVPG